MDEKIYLKLRDKLIEVSEILLLVCKDVKSKEDLYKLRESSFQQVFINFSKLVIAIEYSRDHDMAHEPALFGYNDKYIEPTKRAGQIYLKKNG